MALTKKEILEEIELSERVVLTLSDGYTFDVCPASDYVGGGDGYMCDLMGNIEYSSAEELVNALFRYAEREGLEIEEMEQ